MCDYRVILNFSPPAQKRPNSWYSVCLDEKHLKSKLLFVNAVTVFKINRVVKDNNFFTTYIMSNKKYIANNNYLLHLWRGLNALLIHGS